MSRLVKWNVPFAEWFYPSVTAGFSVSLQGPPSQLHVVVSGGPYPVTSRSNRDPKYLISFTDILKFSCDDEACAPPREFPPIEKFDPVPCAWLWENSPSVESYQRCGDYDENNGPAPLYHYLIFGGDYNVEVIAKRQPKIETIWENREISLVFKF
jgi:hypothetical protein